MRWLRVGLHQLLLAWSGASITILSFQQAAECYCDLKRFADWRCKIASRWVVCHLWIGFRMWVSWNCINKAMSFASLSFLFFSDMCYRLTEHHRLPSFLWFLQQIFIVSATSYGLTFPIDKSRVLNERVVWSDGWLAGSSAGMELIKGASLSRFYHFLRVPKKTA